MEEVEDLMEYYLQRASAAQSEAERLLAGAAHVGYGQRVCLACQGQGHMCACVHMCVHARACVLVCRAHARCVKVKPVPVLGVGAVLDACVGRRVLSRQS